MLWNRRPQVVRLEEACLLRQRLDVRCKLQARHGERAKPAELVQFGLADGLDEVGDKQRRRLPYLRGDPQADLVPCVVLDRERSGVEVQCIELASKGLLGGTDERKSRVQRCLLEALAGRPRDDPSLEILAADG